MYFGNFRVKEEDQVPVPLTRHRRRKPRSRQENEEAILIAMRRLGKTRSRAVLARASGFQGETRSFYNYLADLIKRGLIVNSGTPRRPVLTLASSSGLTGQQRRVLSFIEEHPREYTSLSMFSQQTGVPRGSVPGVLRKLCKEGHIDVASGGVYTPTRHRVPVAPAFNREATPSEVDGGVGGDVPSGDTPMPLVAKSNEQALLSLLDPIVWDYVKTTKDTNLLSFLEWLSRG